MTNKKRIIAAVIVKENIVVQSISFQKFFPIGNLGPIIKNLNRWQADEILILSIDRSKNNLGPNIELLDNLKKFGINTPIIYGGGIKSLNDAKEVIKKGADRIVLETVVQKDFENLKKISEGIGAQSIILSMPLSINKDKVLFYDYKYNKLDKISYNFYKAIDHKLFSELLIIDYKNQGSMQGFNEELLKKFTKKIPLILYGGIYSKKDFEKIFRDKRVSAATIGNNLNYGEHKIQKFKSIFNKKFFRDPFYQEII